MLFTRARRIFRALYSHTVDSSPPQTATTTTNSNSETVPVGLSAVNGGSPAVPHAAHTGTLKVRPTSQVPSSSQADEATPRAKYFSHPPPLSPAVGGSPEEKGPAGTFPSSHVSRSSASGLASIASTRPAPPSPTPSRHTSLRLSSPRSRPISSALSSSSTSSTSPSSKPRQDNTNNGDVTPTVSNLSKKTTMPTSIIKVRDFAYAPTDDRHVGSFMAPASSSSSSKRSSTSSRWSDFASRFSFPFGRSDDNSSKHRSRRRSSGLASPYANQSTMSPTEYQYDDSSGELHSGNTSSEYVEGEGDEDDSEGPFQPGVYRALYAFVPEGPSEMALEEDQLVNVLGRGGGAGWVVVVKDEAGGQALVPEGYLEFVTGDASGYNAGVGQDDGRSDTPTA